MFRDIKLKSTYSSYEDDLGEIFYNPTLKTCVKYDRATAYFSAKSLANYSKGLEVFAKKGNLCRIIVSSEISDEDFEEIKLGYKLKESVREEMIKSLREELSLEEEKNISNLAYLISIGIVEIKMAFTKKGIFHDKFGIMEDEIGDVICFRGSNNETDAAYNYNYEAFDITCSWQTSEFDYTKITKSKKTFEKLWDNTTKDIIVLEFDDIIKNEILKYNKGKIIEDKYQLKTNCVLLDWDKEPILDIRIDKKIITKSTNYKIYLKRYVDKDREENSEIGTIFRFKEEYTYIEHKKIRDSFFEISEKECFDFFVTKRFEKYINENEMYINERCECGKRIKLKDERIFDKFNKYKEIVNSEISRPLREQQMWDSFFMFSMKKSSNFSVPGSGKTASSLGVFACLSKKNLVKRIVMIGPKNSFNSWKDEFKETFGDKKELKCFDIHDKKYKNAKEVKKALKFDTGNSNLLLFNYESLKKYREEVEKIVSEDTLLVFDEVHKVKAVDGKNAKQALEISKQAKYIIALTGTPIPNSYTDIYNLLKILYGKEYKSFFGFDVKALKNPDDMKIEEINEKIQPFFCRTTKEELGVPVVNDDKIISVMATESENRLFQILKTKYYKNKLVLIIRLLQLESNPKLLLKTLDLSDFKKILDIQKEEFEIDYCDFSLEVENLIEKISLTEKFKRCIKLVKELYNENKSVIVWSIFVDSMKNLKQKLSEEGIEADCIYGEVDVTDRNNILEKFKNGDIKVLITNPHTLAESISLHQVCHDAIYFEYSYNLVHLLQSKDRIHRLGLDENQYTQYYFLQEDFRTEDNDIFCLDEKIYKRLKEKEQIMLDAIENDYLEVGSDPMEDIEIIFKDLHL